MRLLTILTLALVACHTFAAGPEQNCAGLAEAIRGCKFYDCEAKTEGLTVNSSVSPLESGQCQVKTVIDGGSTQCLLAPKARSLHADLVNIQMLAFKGSDPKGAARLQAAHTKYNAEMSRLGFNPCTVDEKFLQHYSKIGVQHSQANGAIAWSNHTMNSQRWDKLRAQLSATQDTCLLVQDKTSWQPSQVLGHVTSAEECHKLATQRFANLLEKKLAPLSASCQASWGLMLLTPSSGTASDRDDEIKVTGKPLALYQLQYDGTMIRLDEEGQAATYSRSIASVMKKVCARPQFKCHTTWKEGEQEIKSLNSTITGSGPEGACVRMAWQNKEAKQLCKNHSHVTAISRLTASNQKTSETLAESVTLDVCQRLRVKKSRY